MTKEPKALLVAGDTHGDPQHIMYLFEEAVLRQNVDAIFQVGDFGYWEHESGGSEFLDIISNLATLNDMPFFFIDGNHENHDLLHERYGPGGPQHKPTPEGFWEIRPGLYYVPRGTRWEWSGAKIMGLGGAYSVDVGYRLAREGGYAAPEWGWTEAHVRKFGAKGPRTMVWPDKEEINDEELEKALADKTPLDVLFVHDKPRASNPDWNRKDIAECFPNQDRIQTVVRTLTPKLLIHGHLHYRYTDTIRCGDDDKMTRVEALDCNPELERFHAKTGVVEKVPQRIVDAQRLKSWIRLSLVT